MYQNSNFGPPPDNSGRWTLNGTGWVPTNGGMYSQGGNGGGQMVYGADGSARTFQQAYGIPPPGYGSAGTNGQQPPPPGAGGPPPSKSQGGQYTPDQIKQFVTDKGIGNNPYAMYSYAQQYGVGADQVDKAMGYDAGTSQKWIQQQGLSMPGQPQQPPTMPGAGGPPPSMPQGGALAGMQQTGMTGQQPQNPYMPNSSPTQTPGNQPRPPGQQNPYTQQMGQDITRQVTNNLQRNILPGIGRGAVAAGGYGGSRQGIAEGLAIGETNNNLAGQLANLYSGQFNTDRNYGLQSDALDLNVYNANQNWMNQGQQNQIGLIDKMMNWNQQGVNNATNIQNAPLNYYAQFANIGQGLGGLGGSQTQNLQGNPVLGAIGGYQLGSKMWGG